MTFSFRAALARLRGRIAAASALAFAIAAPGAAQAAPELYWINPTEPCWGDCKAHVYGGVFVRTGLTTIAKELRTPFQWRYDSDYLVAGAVSRPVLEIGSFAQAELELGLGQRFGEQDEQEVWGALYLRQKKFPWNGYVVTTVAINTGLNYATGISAKEVQRSGNLKGSKLLHYLAPEITLAHPDYPDIEFVFRLHHRSGGYGVISDTKGGAQYATVGVRVPF
jgi:hypothetical protein